MKRWSAYFTVVLGTLSVLGYNYYYQDSQALQQELRDVDRYSGAAIQDVNESLHRLVATSEKIANLDSGSLRLSESTSQLCDMMKADQQLNQLGYALEPLPGQQRFGPYCVRENGNLALKSLEGVASYDYTIKRAETAWYHRARDEGDGWSEPYYDPPTNAFLAEYTRRLHKKDGSNTFVGVAFANYSLKTLTNQLKNLDLGRGGYAFIMTRQGRLLSHPSWREVAKDRTLEEFAREHHSMEILKISQWIQQPPREKPPFGPAEKLEDPMTHDPAWIWCGELSETQWVLCTVTIAGSSINGATELAKRRLGLAILLTAICLALLGLAMFLKIGGQQRRSLWAFSLIGTVLLCGGVGSIWYLARENHSGGKKDSAIISAAQIEQVTQKVQASLRTVHRDHDAFATVPTGIHISQITAENKTLHLTGIVWQRYRKGTNRDPTGRLPLTAEMAGGLQGMTVSAAARSEVSPDKADDLPPGGGVTFSGALSLVMEEAFRNEVEGQQVIGWRFYCQLPVQFDAKDFPLDWSDIRLNLVPLRFSEPVLLVPDITAYDDIATAALPGVSPAVRLPGWRLEESSFSYMERTVNSDLGLGEASFFRSLPALRFTISMERVFINPFITHVVPLIILLFLMFSVLMLSSRREGLAERLGFNASALIGAYGTFFFIAVLQHVSLRQSMETAQLVYFEWFYILVYVLLLLLSLNALLFSSSTKVKFVLFEDNLWPKLLYGPLAAAGALVATWVWFY